MEEKNSQQVENNSIQPQVTEKIVTKNNPFLIILLIFFILLFGSLAYLFLTDKVVIEGIDNPLSNEVQEEEEEEEWSNEEDEESDESMDDLEDSKTLLTYENENVGIIFQYPESWEVTEERSNAVETGDITEYDLTLEISNIENPEYIFSYSLPVGTGPEICVYDDTPEEYRDSVQAVEYANYEEFENDVSGQYRRSWNVDRTKQEICISGEDYDAYSRWVEPGYATFYLGSDFDQQLIEEMIDILFSKRYQWD